ncbi:hypothetical protein A4G19_14925 [Pasteurellaceae bacterium Macca]|nr:hypothetical protein [Pasteurellaceae bacterium Macca]
MRHFRKNLFFSTMSLVFLVSCSSRINSESSLHYGKGNLAYYEKTNHWQKKLKQLAQGKNVKFRILQLGDSHTAGAIFTDELRSRLQQRLGNGGIGWIAPSPVAGQSTPQVEYFSQGWQTLTSRKDQDSFPLGGVLARSQFGGNSMVISPRIGISGKQRITFTVNPISTTAQLAIRSGNENVTLTKRSANKWQSVRMEIGLPLIYQTISEQWRIGQINIENSKPGIVVSGMGINGAQFSHWLKWQANWEHNLKETQADLIILAYGTNEAFNDNLDISEMKQIWVNQIRRIRKSLPNAAILIIGAPESLRSKVGQCGTRPLMLDAVQNMQKVIAKQEHTLFWSWQDAMGGRCSMNKWFNQGLAAKDRVHFTASGYRLAASQLANVLLQASK